MSLIFEALKKLEREKQVPEPGFVVVAQRGWPNRRRRLWVAWTGVAAALVVGLGIWGRSPSPAPPEPTPASMPNPALAPPTTPGALEASVPALATSSSPRRPEVIATAPTTRSAGGTASRASVTPGTASQLGVTLPPPPSGPPARLAPRAPDAAAKAPPLVLQAIGRRDGHPVAILGERLVREGDSFDDVRVIRIGEDQVEIEIDGERRTLRF